MQHLSNFVPELQATRGMVFMGGKWEGAMPGDLELGDLAWIARHSNRHLDRVIAQQEIGRRKEIARREAQL